MLSPWSSGCWLPLVSLDFWVKVYVNAVGRQTSAIQHIPLRGTKAPTQLVTSEGHTVRAPPSLLVSLMATMGIEGYRAILQHTTVSPYPPLFVAY